MRYCVNHPERSAIGECVITGKPVCPECSTKYEGVNYSREGLEELKRRRAQGVSNGGRRRKAMAALAVAQAPLSFYMLYLFYLYAFRGAASLVAN